MLFLRCLISKYFSPKTHDESNVNSHNQDDNVEKSKEKPKRRNIELMPKIRQPKAQPQKKKEKVEIKWN